MIFSLWGKFTCIHGYQFCYTVVHCRVCVRAIVYLLSRKIYGLYALITGALSGSAVYARLINSIFTDEIRSSFTSTVSAERL